MQIEINLPAFAIILAAGALLFSGGTFWRANDWRRSDTWKTLTDLVAGLAQKMMILEARTGEMPTKISAINDRLTRVEAHFDALPSKAEFAALDSTVKGIGDEVDVVRDAVVRIEEFLRGQKA
jgi:hypothetical protein